MKILNMVDPNKSQIKFKVNIYPDGQQNIVLNMIQGELNYCFINGVQIKSRLNNFQDLELIVCTTKSLRKLGVKEIHLYTPYFLGSRSDRQFEEGSCNYLKDVICPIINSLEFESVTVLDPHSHVLEACLNNFKKISNESLFRESIRGLYGLAKARTNNDFILVSPDAGATHKIYKLAQDVDYKGDIITCSKERDENGKLTKCVVPKFDVSKDVIIVDDVVDGAGTFINIAKEIKNFRESLVYPATINGVIFGKIYLIVTHGIFSKGFVELSEYFDGIYTTNSYKDIDLSLATLVNNNENLLKQLNVF